MDADRSYLVALGPDPARAVLRAGQGDYAMAGAGPAGAEASPFRESARLTAREQQLTWLLSTRCGGALASRPEPRVGVRK